MQGSATWIKVCLSIVGLSIFCSDIDMLRLGVRVIGSGAWRKYYIASFYPAGDPQVQQLLILTSDNGTDAYPVPTHYVPVSPTQAVRNPAVLYRAGLYYLAHSDWSIFDFTHATHISFAVSLDGQNFTPLARPEFAGVGPFGSDAEFWAGSWLVEADGTLRYFVGASTAFITNLNQLNVYEIHPVTPGDFSAWSTPVALSGSAITAGLYDPKIIRSGSTYYLIVTNTQDSNNIVVLKSTTSPISGWNTVVQSGNWNGFAPGPVHDQPLIETINGETLMYSDVDNTNTLWSRELSGDWATGGATTWSTPVAMTPRNPHQVGAMGIQPQPTWIDATGTITRVQTATQGTGAVSASSLSAVFGSSVPSGHTIIVPIRGDMTAAIASVKDTLGTTYQPVAIGGVGTDPQLWVYWGTTQASGANTVTVTFTNSGPYRWISPLEYSGLSLVQPVAQVGQTGTGVTDLPSPIFSTANSSEVALLIVSQTNFTTYTAGTGYTLVDGAIGGGGVTFGGIQEQICVSPLVGAVAHITSGITDAFTALVVSFKAAQ